MNTINSFVPTVTTDGRFYKNSTSRSSAVSKNSADVAEIKVGPSGSDVIESMVQNAASIKADIQQLQKLSDMVMGRKLAFNVNEELGSVVVKIIDPNTDTVIKEIPSADMQKLKINIRKAIGVIFDDMI